MGRMFAATYLLVRWSSCRLKTPHMHCSMLLELSKTSLEFLLESLEALLAPEYCAHKVELSWNCSPLKMQVAMTQRALRRNARQTLCMMLLERSQSFTQSFGHHTTIGARHSASTTSMARARLENCAVSVTTANITTIAFVSPRTVVDGVE